ncbi:MAG: NUDIX hydrolase, partial [Hyphomicrobiaceae bacterium]
GYMPMLSGLCFFARAITPPGRPRRYDTRFFCVSSDFVGTCRGQPDDELSDIDWYTIDQCTSLDLPPITRVVLEDLSDRLRTIGITPSRHAVPYYHQRRGLFFRELIDVERRER